MSGNPHIYLLTKTFRSKSFLTQSVNIAMRGGGGHFAKPDPQIPKPYNFTRRYRLEDINTVLYHDFAPEYHMHLHSPFIQNAKQGCALLFLYFLFILCPAWWLAQKLQRISGANMFPAVRPGKDHDHMAPKLLNHLKTHNFENTPDFLGRRTAFFYKNPSRQEMSLEMKPHAVLNLEKHGFKF